MMLTKIDKMYVLFGRCKGHKCKECNHHITTTWDKTYHKCECYGLSNCTSTDWKISNTACGLFNKSYEGKKVISVKGIKGPQEQLEGQISLI